MFLLFLLLSLELRVGFEASIVMLENIAFSNPVSIEFQELRPSVFHSYIWRSCTEFHPSKDGIYIYVYLVCVHLYICTCIFCFTLTSVQQSIYCRVVLKINWVQPSIIIFYIFPAVSMGFNMMLPYRWTILFNILQSTNKSETINFQIAAFC